MVVVESRCIMVIGGLTCWRPTTTGIKSKVENKGQYQEYLDELKSMREEMGIMLKEDMYPDEQ